MAVKEYVSHVSAMRSYVKGGNAHQRRLQTRKHQNGHARRSALEARSEQSRFDWALARGLGRHQGGSAGGAGYSTLRGFGRE